jgi:hypothetical protein
MSQEDTVRRAYRQSLMAMTDSQLLEESKTKIVESAYEAIKVKAPSHWQCDYVYEEWGRRGQLDQYKTAYEAVYPYQLAH